MARAFRDSCLGIECMVLVQGFVVLALVLSNSGVKQLFFNC